MSQLLNFSFAFFVMLYYTIKEFLDALLSKIGIHAFWTYLKEAFLAYLNT